MKIFQYLKSKLGVLISQPFILCCIMALTMCLAGQKKVDNMWDFQNYHYYNAFALFNDTSNFLVPGGINTFFNPILDIPLYLYIQFFNNYPTLIYALQGIWGGLLFCAIFKITLLFFNRYSVKAISYALLTICISLCGRITFTQIGSSTNEVAVAAMDLWGIYFILKMIKYQRLQTWYKWILCGVFLGIALGLKQNSITVCIAVGLTLICMYPYIKGTFKHIALFALGGVCGYILINGWFMYQYWQQYGNPLFPFLNGIFKSPYLDQINYNDKTCLPELSFKTFKYYLWKSTQPKGNCENFFRDDFRTNIYNTFALVTLVWALLKSRIRHIYKQYPLHVAVFLLYNFTYFIWFFAFSVLRYMVFIEAIAAIMFVQIFQIQAVKNRFLCFVFGAMCCVLCYWRLSYLHIRPYRQVDSYFTMERLNLPDNTLVKIYGSQSSFIIPELAKNNTKFKSVTYYNNHWNGVGSDCAERGKFRLQRDKIESGHKGPVVYFIHDEQYTHRIQSLVGKRDFFINNLGIDSLEPNMFSCRNLRYNGVQHFLICTPNEYRDIIYGI
ncbi:MAG: hypothetical protein J6N49_06510 [Alphaproteobacteria bacterium]|nr:hypothetical protein [Alphaproteobacteria bacterium]